MSDIETIILEKMFLVLTTLINKLMLYITYMLYIYFEKIIQITCH